MVADNASAGRFVIGPAIPAAGVDLRLMWVVLEHNGAVIDTAAGAAPLGHPASAATRLVRPLTAEDEGLRARDIVFTGGLAAAVPLTAVHAVVATADRLGGVEIRCE
jgi:2-oxo-3-hexenedioate decarboxylase